MLKLQVIPAPKCKKSCHLRLEFLSQINMDVSSCELLWGGLWARILVRFCRLWALMPKKVPEKRICGGTWQQLPDSPCLFWFCCVYILIWKTETGQCHNSVCPKSQAHTYWGWISVMWPDLIPKNSEVDFLHSEFWLFKSTTPASGFEARPKVYGKSIEFWCMCTIIRKQSECKMSGLFSIGKCKFFSVQVFLQYERSCHLADEKKSSKGMDVSGAKAKTSTCLFRFCETTTF